MTTFRDPSCTSLISCWMMPWTRSEPISAPRKTPDRLRLPPIIEPTSTFIGSRPARPAMESRPRDRRGGLDVHALGDHPGGAGGHGAQFRVAAEAAGGDHLVADLDVLDFLADLHDLAGGLVADDVWFGDQLATPAVQRVAALDGDRLDADNDALAMAFGIGDVLVLEDVGAAVLVVDRRLHDLGFPIQTSV